MSNLYYVGFYMLDEHQKDYIKNSTNPQKDIFKAFFATTKITEYNYLINEIIIMDKEWMGEIRIGDVIEDCGSGSMLYYKIFRDDKKIYSNGIENLYIIKKNDFKCFYDWSICTLIDRLYEKVMNYDKLIGDNPYSEIHEALIKYYNS